MKVSKAWLLVANGLIWGAAGINILRLGIVSFCHCYLPAGAADVTLNQWWTLVLASAVFLAFHFMFSSIVRKNVKRIRGCEQTRMPLWNMMPVKSWIILAFMMSLGISLKLTGIATPWFMSFFYTGLGSALAISGLRYIIRGSSKSL